MFRIPDNPMLGERLVSGAASTVLSLGVVLVLASISSGGNVREAARSSMSTFDLAPSGQSAPAVQEPQQTTPPPAQAEPPSPDPGRRKVPELGKVAASQPEEIGQGGPPADPVIQPAARKVEAAQETVLLASIVQPVRSMPTPEPAATSRAEPRAQAAPGRGGGGGGYKAEVWRHLLQYRRSNAVGPGAALVSFTVGDSGSVGDVGIARSSGSQRFDGEAMQMVRRAQPFPKPPPGVPRAFTFEIKGG